MVDLQPRKGDSRVAIPFTFEGSMNINSIVGWRLLLAGGMCLASLILWIVILFIAEKDDYRWIATAICLVGIPLVARYAVVGEHKFRKGYQELKEHDYTFSYSSFWNIYDTSTTAPTFFLHNTDCNSIFVAFDKDVVVGKGDDSDFYHYDALSEAYNLLAKKEGIFCTHIDYMDNVGKDLRLQGMMDSLKHCPYPILRDNVYDMYEYMQVYMSDTFSDYDVYCFTSNMRTDLMYDELEPIFNAFMNANYIRYRVLTRQEVRELVASVMGLPDFSVTRSCDTLFSSKHVGNALRVIWTEKDGVREKVNKTEAELEAEINAARAAKNMKHNRKATNIQGTSFADSANTKQTTATPANNSPFTRQTGVQNPQQRPVMPANTSPFAKQSVQAVQNKGTQSPAFKPQQVNQQSAMQPRQVQQRPLPENLQKLKQQQARANGNAALKAAKPADTQDAFAQLNQRAAQQVAARTGIMAPSGSRPVASTEKPTVAPTKVATPAANIKMPVVKDMQSDTIDLFGSDSDDDEIDLFGN